MAETENVMSLQRYLNACISAMWNNTDYYLSFLRTSARMYKYNFQDQVLIHDSRPNATACAESKTWCNDDIHRSIAAGAKAIPLLTTNNGRIGLRYVYDYADTSAIDERSKSPMFWQVKAADEKAVLNVLGNTGNDTLANAILKKAHEIVSEQSELYFNTLSENTADTFLEELDELNLKARFDTLLEKSIAYAVLERCGAETDAYFENNDFNGVYEFNSVGAMTALGAAVSDLSEQILRTIERTIKAERRKENDISQNNNRENSLRTEDNLQPGRTDENVYSAASTVSAESGRKIRDNANELSQEIQQSDVSGAADNGKAERASFGDRQDSSPQIGADDPADDDVAGRDGTAEIRRPDQVDGSDEQYSASGGGDSPKRADLQLNNNTAVLNGSAFSMPKYLIDGILKHDEFFKIKRDAIVEFFLLESDSVKRTEFMKTVFNNDYSEFDVSGVRCGYKSWANDKKNAELLSQSDGLEMWVGNFLTKSEETIMSWESVARRVGELIDTHEYLIDDKTFDIEPEIEEQGGYDNTAQLSLFDIDVQQSDTSEEIKENLPITAYRVGDFYEFYGEDARIAAKVIEISITSRNGEPMTGIPAHALDMYKSQLLDKGYALIAEEKFPEQTKLPSAETDEERIVSAILSKLDMADTTVDNVYDRITELLADMLFGEELSKSEEAIVNELLNDDAAQFLAFETRLPEALKAKGLPWKADYEIPADLDKYYVDKENELITQVYYNPDSSSGGQLVYNRFSFEDLSDALKTSDPLQHLESISRQELIDVDDPAFPKRAREFLEDNEDFNSTKNDIYAKLSALLPKSTPAITQVAIESTDDLTDSNKAAEQRQTRDPNSEIPESNSPLVNFTITDDNLGVGNAKTKYRANIEAIRLLNTIEAENRTATAKEQETLSKYVGWGGLAQAFDEKNSAWSDEYMDLLTLLSPEEYESLNLERSLHFSDRYPCDI